MDPLDILCDPEVLCLMEDLGLTLADITSIAQIQAMADRSDA